MLKDFEDSDNEEEDEDDELISKNINSIEEELLVKKNFKTLFLFVQNIKPEDEEAISKFFHPKAEEGVKTLYDLIQAKILEKKVSFKETFGNTETVDVSLLLV